MAEPTDDTTVNLYDFDAAIGEVEERPFSFKYEGMEYTVDLNVEAGPMLVWMESADTIRAIPALLRIFLDDEQYKSIVESSAKFPKMEALVSKFAEELGGGSGN